MNLTQLIDTAKTGDILTTRSSIWVRLFTGESFSHSAIVLKEFDETYVVETHENVNDTTVTKLSEWVNEYDEIWLGIPPTIITQNRLQVEAGIYRYLDQDKHELKYGYKTLPLVFWNQVFPSKKFNHKLNVCSTLVGELWRLTGWDNDGKLMDPGDVFVECITSYKLEK